MHARYRSRIEADGTFEDMRPRIPRLIGRLFGRHNREAERRACEAARLAETSVTCDGKVDEAELLEQFVDGASAEVLDAIRDFYERPEADEWLRSAKERGLIAGHADGSVSLTAQGRSSVKRRPTSIRVGLPARTHRARKS